MAMTMAGGVGGDPGPGTYMYIFRCYCGSAFFHERRPVYIIIHLGCKHMSFGRCPSLIKSLLVYGLTHQYMCSSGSVDSTFPSAYVVFDVLHEAQLKPGGLSGPSWVARDGWVVVLTSNMYSLFQALACKVQRQVNWNGFGVGA